MILYNRLFWVFLHKALRYMKADTVLFHQFLAQRMLNKYECQISQVYALGSNTALLASW